MKRQKCFTLIEFLIIVCLLGIMAAIVISGYMGLQERKRQHALITIADEYAVNFQNKLKDGGKAELIVKRFFGGYDKVLEKTSPWNHNIPLWYFGGNAEHIGYCQSAYFDLSAYGRIGVCVNSKKDEIYLYAESPWNLELLYHKTISKK